GSGVVTTAGAAARPPEPLLRRRAVGGGPREPSRRYRGAALHRGARHGRTGTYGGRVTGPGARGGRMRGPEGSHVVGGPSAHAAESVPHAAAATGSRAVGHVLCTTITLDLLTRPRPGRFCLVRGRIRSAVGGCPGRRRAPRRLHAGRRGPPTGPGARC